MPQAPVRMRGRGREGRSVLFDRYFDSFAQRVVAEAERSVTGAAGSAISMIKRRTQVGVDIHGQRFRKYAPSTVRHRRRKGLRIGLPNLRETGQMLDSLVVRKPLSAMSGLIAKKDVTFSNQRAKRIARYHVMGTRHMPRRDFFGLSTPETRLITDEFGVNIFREMPRDGRRRITLKVF